MSDTPNKSSVPKWQRTPYNVYLDEGVIERYERAYPLQKKTRIIVGGRASGKTFMMLSTIFAYSEQHPHTRCMVYCPNVAQREYLYREYLQRVKSTPAGRNLNHNDMQIWHGNGALVMFTSDEAYLRGHDLAILVVTGVSGVDPGHFMQYIRSGRLIFDSDLDSAWIVRPQPRFKWGDSIYDIRDDYGYYSPAEFRMLYENVFPPEPEPEPEPRPSRYDQAHDKPWRPW